MRRIVSALLATSTASLVAGCALLVSFDGLEGPQDASDAPPSEVGAPNPGDAAVDTGGDASAGDASSLFLGCFVDSHNRDLPYSAYDSQLSTIEACVAACIAKGYLFAATQYGSECFCGNAYGGQGPARGCTMPCTGDPTEKCGGNFVNSVFVAIGPAPHATPVGCYADSMTTRELPDQVFGGAYTTVESCAAGCAYHGYLYSGPENGNQCFCGNSYGSQGDAGSCSVPCTGNAAEFCGGYYANSVSRTWVPADAGSGSSDAGKD